jgi:hypothetical protein
MLSIMRCLLSSLFLLCSGNSRCFFMDFCDLFRCRCVESDDLLAKGGRDSLCIIFMGLLGDLVLLVDRLGLSLTLSKGVFGFATDGCFWATDLCADCGI